MSESVVLLDQAEHRNQTNQTYGKHERGNQFSILITLSFDFHSVFPQATNFYTRVVTNTSLLRDKTTLVLLQAND